MTSSPVEGFVVRGHRVASGSNHDPLFPGGTLAMQLPHFAALGLDLGGWHLATLNISIAPRDFEIINPDWCFENVLWHPTEPAEDFSFVNIAVSVRSAEALLGGLLYYPHPGTKPAHHQPAGVMEILLRQYIEDFDYGSPVKLYLPAERVKILIP